jgi:hypothetical protein
MNFNIFWYIMTYFTCDMERHPRRLPTICRHSLLCPLGSLHWRNQQKRNRPPHRPPPRSRARRLYASRGWAQPLLTMNRCRSFRKSDLCTRAQMNVRCSVHQAVNPIVFNNFEMRFCNFAQNNAHIKSDDYDYVKSCTADIYCATRIINRL